MIIVNRRRDTEVNRKHKLQLFLKNNQSPFSLRKYTEMTVHGGKLFFLFIKAALLPRNVLETAKMVISSPVFCILLILKKNQKVHPNLCCLSVGRKKPLFTI